MNALRIVAPVALLAILAARPVLPGHGPFQQTGLASFGAGGLETILSAAVPVSARRTAEPGIPDTQAGKCAREFLAVLADGSLPAVKTFEETWASKKRLAAKTVQERSAALTEARERWIGAKAVSSFKRADSGITVSVELKHGETAELEFNFDPAEPGKLEFVMIAVEADQGGHGGGGSGGRPALPPLNAETRAATVKAACQALLDGYVFPEVAQKMAALVTGKLEKGEYDAITSDRELASRLQDDFRSVSNDKHLGVSAAPGPMTQNSSIPEDGPSEEQRAEMRRRNYAFQKVEILPGNVGYLRFDLFVDDEEARATAAGAMAFLRHCDALIIDLRQNGGGSPAMIAFLTTYLFDQKTHLNDMIDRNGKIVEEFYTLDTVPGQRLGSALPVFVLTSKRTFSGAEEFSYNLKNLKRATLIGETTGGGAHPVHGERITDRFMIRVPFMRACNPITKTNWEGTGVAPDISVPAGEALDRAVSEATKAAGKHPGN